MVAVKTNRGRPPKVKKLLKDVFPVGDLLDEDELAVYSSLVDVYMRDFDEEDLNSTDIDDIMGMAINKVLEMRLLKSAKGNSSAQLDISNALEKLRKQTEKMKENLSSRRRDRVDPNTYKGFSIVDLAVAFDEDKRIKLRQKSLKLKEEESASRKLLKDNPGNRYDNDGREILGE